MNLLELLLANIKPLFLCLCEHWLNIDNANAIYIPDYVMVDCYIRKNSSRGGSAIFTSREAASYCKPLKFVNKHSEEINFECSAIEYQGSTCIINIYINQQKVIITFSVIDYLIL